MGGGRYLIDRVNHCCGPRIYGGVKKQKTINCLNPSKTICEASLSQEFNGLVVSKILTEKHTTLFHRILSGPTTNAGVPNVGVDP